MPQDYDVCKHHRGNQLKRLKAIIELLTPPKSTSHNALVTLCSALSGKSLSTTRRYLKGGKIPKAFFSGIAQGLEEKDQTGLMRGQQADLTKWLMAGFEDSQSFGEDCWTLYYRIMVKIDKTNTDIVSYTIGAGLRQSIKVLGSNHTG